MVTTEIDWAAYSQNYDLLCNNNDAYKELVNEFLNFCEKQQLNSSSTVADLGAGTGNFALKMREVFSEGVIFHVDSNKEMNRIACKKYEQLDGVIPTIIESEIQKIEFPPKSLDLVVCINALYAMQPQQLILQKVYDWLKPGGFFYIVDLGRPMNSRDWGLHFLKNAAKQRWLLKYLRNAFKAREVFKQNRLTTLAQDSGRYWVHSTEDFQGCLEGIGFRVDNVQECYRGYADVAICRR